MGDFADDAINRDMDRWLDEQYDPSNQFDDQFDGAPEDFQRCSRRKASYTRDLEPSDKLEYEEIRTETEKAWLLMMDSGRLIWWPKSRCTLDDEDYTITAPHWLVLKKIEEMR